MALSRKLPLAILAVTLTLVVVWYEHRPTPPSTEVTCAHVEKEAQAGGYQLITTDQLAARHRQDPGSLLVVDTRQAWEYRSGHITGAVNFPIEPTWWGRWRAQGPLAKLLGSDKNRWLVFY